MTTSIIIAICSLLLLGYIFDLTSSKTKIPSVILLLVLGFLIRYMKTRLQIYIPDLSFLLPIVGTLGLVLIVLESSLDLKLTKNKIPVIKKSLILALVPIIILTLLFGIVFHFLEPASLKDSFLNAIPLCVISSAIAIPSAINFLPKDREFVIYESSLSDIIGILLFNFLLYNEIIETLSFGKFGAGLMIIIIISFIASVGISFLLKEIEHHVKFAPIILLVILIYAISKVYHLPSLIFILVFGLFLGNLEELKKYKLIKKLQPHNLDIEIKKFKDITIEASFMVRALFFLIFGYVLETDEVFDTTTFAMSLWIVSGIYLFRIIQLKILNLHLIPLLFVAPRGLITILLFLSIPAANSLTIVNKSLITQVVLITVFLMMAGVFFGKEKSKPYDNGEHFL